MSDDIRYYDREAVKEAMLKAIKWGQERAETSVFLPEEVSDRYLRDNPGNVWNAPGVSPEVIAKFQKRVEVLRVVRHTIKRLRDREWINDYEADEIVESYLAANIPPEEAEETLEFIPEEVDHIFTEYVVKIASAAVEAAIRRIKEES